VTLGLLILTSVTVLTLDFRNSGLIDSARDAAANVVGPVRDAVETATEPVTDAWNGMTRYGDLEAENQRLRERLEELEGEASLDTAAAEELDTLLDQLEIEWIGDILETKARVVSGPASSFSHTIEIDKGAGAGIREGMPVVTGAGLVGRVVQASSNRSTVQLLTDPDFRVGVKVEGTRGFGTARGNGRDEPLTVDSNLEADAEIGRGTELLTSGTDRSAYPGLIPVARVTSTRESSDGLSLELHARPLVDLDELAYVTVLLWEPAE
jgi:rod shape-determining protein MreC